MQEKWGKCYLNTSKFCGDRRHFKEFYFPAAQTIHLLQSDELGVSKVTLPRAGSEGGRSVSDPPAALGLVCLLHFPFSQLQATPYDRSCCLCVPCGGSVPCRPLPPPTARAGGWEPRPALPPVVRAVSKPRRLRLTLRSLSVCPSRATRTGTSSFWEASRGAVGLGCAFSVDDARDLWRLHAGKGKSLS